MNYQQAAVTAVTKDATTKSERLARLQREANAAHRKILAAPTRSEARRALAQIVRLKQKQIAVAAGS